MIFKQIRSGGDRNFSYLVSSQDKQAACVIDPSPDPGKVIEVIKAEGIIVGYLINTHLHYDHSGGNDAIKKEYEKNGLFTVNTSREDLATDGMTISLKEVSLKIIKTPGHTSDSICVLAGNRLITGDTLFVGKIGGTYSRHDAEEEFNSLKKLTDLPPSTEVWPGHDYGEKPSSTIKYEIENNPFLKRLGDFKDFLWLKQNWAAYKIEHGIA